MYNKKQTVFVGKHDYDKDAAMYWVDKGNTFSIGIFQWELKSNGKEMKRGKVKGSGKSARIRL